MFIHFDFPRWVTPLGTVDHWLYFVEDAGSERTRLLRSNLSNSHWDLQRDIEPLALYHQPIDYFQRAVLTPCKRFFYSVGKVIRNESDDQDESIVGYLILIGEFLRAI